MRQTRVIGLSTTPASLTPADRELLGSAAKRLLYCGATSTYEPCVGTYFHPKLTPVG